MTQKRDAYLLYTIDRVNIWKELEEDAFFILDYKDRSYINELNINELENKDSWVTKAQEFYITFQLGIYERHLRKVIENKTSLR